MTLPSPKVGHVDMYYTLRACSHDAPQLSHLSTADTAAYSLTLQPLEIVGDDSDPPQADKDEEPEAPPTLIREIAGVRHSACFVLPANDCRREQK